MCQNQKSNIRSVGLTILILVGILGGVFAYRDVIAWYSSKYTESAHGSSASGVKRHAGELTSDYAQGNCAHCHEQHASIGGSSHTAYKFALFAEDDPDSQTDNFCFECHKNLGSVQEGGITNDTYSTNFGGGTSTFTTIYDAFNPTTGATPSSHSLSDIQDYVTGHSGFTSDTNPCVVCHGPHIAQDNHPVVLSGRGGVNTAIRRPTHYQNLRTNLWGDEDLASSGYLERMRDATNNYQSPLRSDSGYEPTGGITPEDQNGSYLPNFATFCNDCHSHADVRSTERGRNLIRIDWGTEGDYHGLNYQGGTVGASIAPYSDPNYNYVLSCTDCHEAHGSQNEWLLRTCVNGVDNVSVPGPGRFWYFCHACHTINQHYAPWDDSVDCSSCHRHSTSMF